MLSTDRPKYPVEVCHKSGESSAFHIQTQKSGTEKYRTRLTKDKMLSTLQPVVLGDLNADCSYANYDERMAANDYLTINTTYTWVIDDDADTTVKTSTDCAYDRSFSPCFC